MKEHLEFLVTYIALEITKEDTADLPNTNLPGHNPHLPPRWRQELADTLHVTISPSC